MGSIGTMSDIFYGFDFSLGFALPFLSKLSKRLGLPLFGLTQILIYPLHEDQMIATKNYAVHQSFEDPGSASQQSECNDPAPHYPACHFDHKAGPAR